MGTRWSGTLAPVGVSNDDMRQVKFAENALSTRGLPLALMWQPSEENGHDGSVVVGTIDQFAQDGTTNTTGAGEWFDDPDAPEDMRKNVEQAMFQVDKGVLGASVRLEPDMDIVPVYAGTEDPFDPDNHTRAELLEGDIELEMLVTRAVVMNASLVPRPAFKGTLGAITTERVDEDEPELVDDDPEMALVASVIGSTDLPVASTDREWSGSSATDRMASAGADTMRRGHLYRDPDGDPQAQSSYKLPFADVIDGTLTIVPRGVAAVAGGRGVNAADIPSDEKAAIRRKVCTLYRKIRSKDDEWGECPFESSGRSSAELATIVASLGTERRAGAPTRAYFADPQLNGPTRITYADDGRVFGHLALHNSCHARWSNVCVTPPDSSVDFRHFHRHVVETDDGIVWTGRLTAGGHHADEGLSMTAAMNVYDDKTVVAHVVAGSDEHGIWIAGVMEPDLDETTTGIVERRKISGDWRETPDGLELIEVLALQEGPKHLSEPGFPVVTHVSNGRQTALIAAAGPFDDEKQDWGNGVPPGFDVERFAESVGWKVVEITESKHKRQEARDRLNAVLADDARAELVDTIGEG